MTFKQLAILFLGITSAVGDKLAAIDVRELDAVPDGNYLAILSLGGTDHQIQPGGRPRFGSLCED
ncbi:MAG: hypothetical protein L7V86_20760 [Verrucomicrobiales bacterium]|nr:hypothetical protein [Verrucomicrobiales bacterium]